jgi:hypothetical protein
VALKQSPCISSLLDNLRILARGNCKAPRLDGHQLKLLTSAHINTFNRLLNLSISLEPLPRLIAIKYILKMAIDATRKTMELEVLSYERLKAQDSDEVQKMVRVLSNQGVFFLDMKGPSAKGFLADLPPVLRHQRNFFERTPEVKNKFHTGEYYKGSVDSSSSNLQ